MLRIFQNRLGDGAKSYYSTSDYYTERQELMALWRCRATARPGLADEVRTEAWDALCENLDPPTGPGILRDDDGLGETLEGMLGGC